MTGKERLRLCCRTKIGCVTETDIDDIANDPTTANVMLLVRCLKDRFLAPARMVRHYIEVIEADPDDRVRDVNVPAVDFNRWGGTWRR